MNRRFWLVVAALLPGIAGAQSPKELVGRYQMEVDPSQTLELRADGTGSMSGEALKWSARGNVLTLTDESGTESSPYALSGDRLVIVAGGFEVGFKKVKARAAEKQQKQPRQPAAAPKPTKGTPQDEQLKKLLLSSAWCSFSYGGAGGAGGYSDHSSTSRAVFKADGTGFRSSGGESYSTGYGGQMSGSSQGGQPFQWRVQNQRLLVDAGEGLQDVNLQVSRNSNGYAILNAAGVEYMMCN